MARWHPVANPTLISVGLLAVLLLGGGVAYRDYFSGAQFVHFLLGPATLALAVPLYRQWQDVRRSAIAVPRSVTTPVAMGIAERLGGLPSLTAVVVNSSGILGAAVRPLVLNLARVKDWWARGLAMGTAAHGVGTARALRVNETAGAFAGLATALFRPLIWRLVVGFSR